MTPLIYNYYESKFYYDIVCKLNYDHCILDGKQQLLVFHNGNQHYRLDEALLVLMDIIEYIENPTKDIKVLGFFV